MKRLYLRVLVFLADLRVFGAEINADTAERTERDAQREHHRSLGWRALTAERLAAAKRARSLAECALDRHDRHRALGISRP